MLLSPIFPSQSAEWLTIGSALWTKRWQSIVGPGLWRAPTRSWRWRAGSWHSLGTWNGGWFGCQHPAQSPRLAPDSSCRDKRGTWEEATMETGARFLEDSLVPAIKNVNGRTLWPSNSISRYPTEMVAWVCKDMCTKIFTALFFYSREKENQFNNKEVVSTFWHTHIWNTTEPREWMKQIYMGR